MPTKPSYSCSAGCESHWRHRRQNSFTSLSPSASGQLQTGQTSKLLVLFSLGLSFLPALEKDEQKIAVEQHVELIKSNNSLGARCSPQKPSEGCTREFADIMENTASVLVPFREKETSADIAAIFREIERTWTVVLHSMGES